MKKFWNIAALLLVLATGARWGAAQELFEGTAEGVPFEVERMDHRCLLDTPNEELPSSRFKRAKVYVDCNSFGPHSIEMGVRLYGADRIVCGTDGSEFGCTWTSNALKEADISAEAREQILHRNATAMMARVPAARQRLAA